MTSVWRRYVAIGDSFTEGMRDPDPAREGEFLGWADRLACALSAHAHRQGAELGYANLAIRGKQLAHITDVQLPAALEMRPDLISLAGGGNDILRPRVDVDALLSRLEAAVVRARQAGADVLLGTGFDLAHTRGLGFTRPRGAIYTAGIWSIAARHGCTVLDMWGLRSLRDPRMWASDRIHLTTEGHRRVAGAAAHALGVDESTDWATPLDPLPRPRRIQAARETAVWAREHGAPWVQRRLRGTSSGDGRAPKRALGPVDGISD